MHNSFRSGFEKLSDVRQLTEAEVLLNSIKKHLIHAGVGATTGAIGGALVDYKDPLRGARVGGTVGAIGGYGTSVLNSGPQVLVYSPLAGLAAGSLSALATRDSGKE